MINNLTVSYINNSFGNINGFNSYEIAKIHKRIYNV